MVLRKLLILFLFAGLGSSALLAQQYPLKTYTTRHGMGSAQVYAILQDSDGFMWFGTYGGGISKFNGQEFRNYSRKDGLCGNNVLCLYEDEQGNIWVGTYGDGVSRFDGRDFKNFDVSDGLPDNVVRDIVQDSTGVLWFATEKGGIARYSNGAFELITKVHGLPSDRVMKLIRADNGVWACTANGVVKVTLEGEVKKKKVFGADQGVLWTAMKGSEENFWTASYGGGVVQYAPGGKRMDSVLAANNSIVYALLEDDQRRVWMGTDDQGIAILEGDELLRINEANGLPHNRVRTLYRDREKNIWIGTDGGVSRFSGTQFSRYGERTGLQDEKILSVAEDDRGDIWLGTFSEGLYSMRFEGSGFMQLDTILRPDLGQDLKDKRVWALLHDSRGRMWIGTTNGLYIYDDGEVEHLRADGDKIPHNVIYDLEEGQNGNIFIASDGGFTVYDGVRYHTYDTDDGFGNLRIRCIEEGPEGALWIGTYAGGAYKYDGKDISRIKTPKGKLEDAIVYSIAGDKRGNIWIGTYGNGVLHINAKGRDTVGEFGWISIGDGLVDNSVLIAGMDGMGRLWIGTQQALHRMDIEKSFRKDRIILEEYGAGEGYTGVEFHQDAIFRDSRFNTWFGTLRGAYRYDPREEVRNLEVPPVHITDVKLNYGKADISDYADSLLPKSDKPLGLSLPWHENHLTVEYAGLSFRNPEGVRFQYKLEGTGHGWSPVTKDQKATFAELSPGHYTFRVRAKNADDIWNEEGASFAFRVRPPFWSTWWFGGGLGSLLLLGLVLGWQWRTRTLQARKQALERMVRDRTQSLEEAKQEIEKQNERLNRSLEEKEFLMKEIHHRVKNNLQVVISLLNLQASHIKGEKAFKSLYESQERVRAMAFIHQTLYQSQDFSEIDFRDYTEKLVESLMPPDKNVEHEIRTNGLKFSVDTAIPLGLIINELVSNAFKHAFTGEEKGGWIKVEIGSIDEKEYQLTVADNGGGLDNDARAKADSIGLDLVDALSEQISGSVSHEVDNGTVFRVRFRDLSAEQSEKSAS